jgi:quinol monooxygenase YgiN
MAKEPVVVVIRYQAQPGQSERASTELRALIREVVALEPDCLGIRLHVDAGDATRFLLYERWTSQAAYAGPHMQTPHLGAFIAKAGEVFAGPPVIEYWHLTDDVVLS